MRRRVCLSVTQVVCVFSNDLIFPPYFSSALIWKITTQSFGIGSGIWQILSLVSPPRGGDLGKPSGYELKFKSLVCYLVV